MKFVLAGEKLKGEFALVRTRRDEKSWLLIKKKDSYATTVDILAENRSVASHRTLEELSEDEQEDDPRKLSKIRLAEALESDILRDAPASTHAGGPGADAGDPGQGAVRRPGLAL